MNFQAPLLAGLLVLQGGAHAMHASPLIDNLNAGKKQIVVAYGTSLTAGGQWVSDLQTWLNERHPGQVTVINSGMGGKASNTGLAELDARVIAHKPDVVFLEFAINDASTYKEGGIDYGISLERSRANLNQLIDRIRQANPSVEIILQTMNPPWDATNGNQSASRRPQLADYYEGYRKVAAERGLLLIDHYAAWSQLQKTNRATYERYIPDGVHPAPEGSTAITFAGIKSALSLPTKSNPDASD